MISSANVRLKLFNIHSFESSFCEFLFRFRDHTQIPTEVPLCIWNCFNIIYIDSSCFESCYRLTSHMNMEIDIGKSSKLFNIVEFSLSRDGKIEWYFLFLSLRWRKQSRIPKRNIFILGIATPEYSGSWWRYERLDHIINRSKSRSCCDEYFWRCCFLHYELAKNSLDANIRSNINFTKEFCSSSLFWELDREGISFFLMTNDRVWSCEWSLSILPEK